ncbi:MAG: flagellar biosynthetic protein FliO [Candidatus Protochlamydia sp.]|nr:flagellar biosynthetic protein FliO [Candidatus Protochlamydia sp.]
MKAYLLIPFLLLLPFSISTYSYGQDNRSSETGVNQEQSDQNPYLETDKPLVSEPRDRILSDDLLYDTNKESRLNPAEPDDFQSKFMNMLFMLGLLIGFMLFASWLLKRMSRSRVTNLNQGSDIKVLETRYLSPRATLYLLDLHGKNILIAESPMGVSHISSFRSLEEDDNEFQKAPSTVT